MGLRLIVKQAYKFSITGSVGAFVNYMIFSLLYKGLCVNYIYSSVIAFLLSALVIYNANKDWTFGETFKKKPHQFSIFIGFMGVSLMFGIIVLYLLTEIALLSPMISQIFAMSTTALMNFIVSKYIIFN